MLRSSMYLSRRPHWSPASDWGPSPLRAGGWAQLAVLSQTNPHHQLFMKTDQRPNPKFLTWGWSRLWHRVAHGICVGVLSGVDIRWGYSERRHRIPYTMFFFGFSLFLGSLMEGPTSNWCVPYTMFFFGFGLCWSCDEKKERGSISDPRGTNIRTLMAMSS